MLPSDVNTTFMYPVVDATACTVEYVPDSSASSCCPEQPTSVHWNTRTRSLPGCVLNSVKVMDMTETAGGAIIHVQFAALAYPDTPDSSESVPISLVNRPQADPHPVHG